MAATVITLEKLLANDSALLAFGLDMPNNFFANPSWREMIHEDENGNVYIHPLGSKCHGELGKPIVLPKNFTFYEGNKTLSTEDKSVVIKNKNGQLYIEMEYSDEFHFYGTQMIFGYEKDYFRAEVFSYHLPFFLQAKSLAFTGERSTSYFDASGIEIKRDRAYSVEHIQRQGAWSREKLIALLSSTAICKQYASTIDQNYSLKDKIFLSNGSFITRMTYHRDENRPDVVWIGPKEDKMCAHLAKHRLPMDTRFVIGSDNWIASDMPEELDENSVEQFIDSASGNIETKVALARFFGEKGKPWLVKHEIILEK